MAGSSGRRRRSETLWSECDLIFAPFCHPSGKLRGKGQMWSLLFERPIFPCKQVLRFSSLPNRFHSQGRWETRLEHRTARSCASKNTKVLFSRRIQTSTCIPRRILLAHAPTIRFDGGWAVVAFGLLKSDIAADPSYFVHRGFLNKAGWSALLTNLEKKVSELAPTSLVLAPASESQM